MSFTVDSNLIGDLSSWITRVEALHVETSGMREELQQLANKKYQSFSEFGQDFLPCLGGWEAKVIAAGISNNSVFRLVDKKIHQIIFKDLEQALLTWLDLAQELGYEVNSLKNGVGSISSMPLTQPDEIKDVLKKMILSWQKPLGPICEDSSLTSNSR